MIHIDTNRSSLRHYAASRKVVVRFPMRSFEFSIELLLPAAVVLWVAESLTEISTRKLPGGKGWPVRKADINSRHVYDLSTLKTVTDCLQ
jgi:hypothetical protein